MSVLQKLKKIKKECNILKIKLKFIFLQKFFFMVMKDMQKLGIWDYKSVKTKSNKTSEHSSCASYFKVKPGSNTSPRLNTRLVKMPEGVL